MGTSLNIQCWSTTAASNDGIDSGVGTLADSMNTITVDNAVRAVMAAAKKYSLDLGGALAAGGSANAITVTTNQALSQAHVTDGLTLRVRATATNTSTTVTFAPDSLTATNIKTASGGTLPIGAIRSGMYLDLAYNATSAEWRCLNIAPPVEAIIVAASDETTALTTGTGKMTWRLPYAFTVNAVRASLVTAQASGNIFTVDINESGTTILSTKLTIDNTEKTSTTAVTAAVISDTSLADDAEMSIDIDQIGNGSAKGLKVALIGYRT